MSDPTPRWHYRFDNFHRAFSLLRDAMEQEQPLSQLETEGVIQRFEYTMELAWKTLKDYLESENVVLDQITPRTVIRRAFEAGVGCLARGAGCPQSYVPHLQLRGIRAGDRPYTQPLFGSV